MRKLLVSGGAGFIGANFVHHWRRAHPSDALVVLDVLTYAGNRDNLASLSNDPNFRFVKGDICDEELVKHLFAEHEFDTVVHMAAESHVDRSIARPDAFINTNVVGTHVLLKAARSAWGENAARRRFHHISTDEVFGSLAPDQAPWPETAPYDPRSPYAASKAASDFLVRAYGSTYGLPVTISNSSNNYGPYQFPEKLIPLMIINALNGQQLPIYGDGANVRDWLHVHDHCLALVAIIENGRIGESYNVAGKQETTNLDLVLRLCDLLDETFTAMPALAERFRKCPAANGAKCRELVEFVRDRPGHDRRYGLQTDKIGRELGFAATRPLAEGLRHTLDWYLANEIWWRAIEKGEYRTWIESHYGFTEQGP